MQGTRSAKNRPPRSNINAHTASDIASDVYHSSPASLPTTAPSDNNSDDLDHLNEVVMSVDLNGGGTVGCCYYVARHEKLFFMEDVKLGGLDVIDALRLYVEPTVVLVSNRIDDAVLDRFDPEAKRHRSETKSNDQFQLPFLLEVRPSTEFRYEAAKLRLVNLRLADDDGPRLNFVVPGDVVPAENYGDDDNMTSRQGHLLRLAGWIDVDSRLTVGCAGAILGYVQRRRTAVYLPGDESALTMFRISSLEMFSLRDTMFINADTLHSLQVLESESHPNSHNQGPTSRQLNSKEGLSLYGLFRHLACTHQGRYLLRQYFLRPSLNLDIINERLDTASVFLHPENEATFDSLVLELRSIKNMRTILIKLRKGVGGGSGSTKVASNDRGVSKSVWAGIREFAYHALKIKDALQAMTGGQVLTIRTKVIEKFENYHLAQLGRRISETVDFERSMEESHTVIVSGVDEELDHMKHTFEALSPLLGEVARKLSEHVPADVQGALNVIYFPQIGFLTTVPLDPATNAAVYDGGIEYPWERMFSTEEHIYFKNNEMREMDDHFGDLYGMISDREIEISHELAQFVLEYETLLTTTSDICGELDSLTALARGAREYKLCKPRMTRNNIIDIHKGRHILQELTVPSFVPNDTILHGGVGADRPIKENFESLINRSYNTSDIEKPREKRQNIMILTGPNYSGKSVYLKQVALIVFMAHIGCFVPAETATIGLTDKILSRVTTRETVSHTQSAFMIDLQQISLALSLATRRSLLIVDEFGKGTDSSDGGGLACSVFEHLASLGSSCPKVVGATHFHEIFESDIFKHGPAISFKHLEVRVDTNASTVEEQITYLYNLRHGRSTSSFGTCCAAINHVPADIVRRAEELILIAARGEDLVSACSVMPASEAAELQEAVRQCFSIRIYR
ncbi:muts domain V-domain-containing protein [Dendryphion nanum]|uniref:Muts domain V-domain-containing protein n=1 Tax=Dendryphion nanum TaxID=256645 RepID=A0A9P9E1M3_9PLEO|nr:muts domain V-domain-containing protein [Dendryphion nanum]